jgi:hypothetical protein
VKIVVVVRIVGGDGRPRWRRLDGRGTPEVEKVERREYKDAMRENRKGKGYRRSLGKKWLGERG